MRVITHMLLTLGLALGVAACGSDEAQKTLDAAKEKAGEAAESAQEAAQGAADAARQATEEAVDKGVAATEEAVDKGVAAVEEAKGQVAAAAGGDAVARCKELAEAQDWAAALAPCTRAHEEAPDDLAITHAFQQAEAAAKQ